MQTFIVRVWPEPGTLRGRVEHIPTGRAELFHDADSLCDFLTAVLDPEPELLEDGSTTPA